MQRKNHNQRKGKENETKGLIRQTAFLKITLQSHCQKTSSEAAECSNKSRREGKSMKNPNDEESKNKKYKYSYYLVQQRMEIESNS